MPIFSAKRQEKKLHLGCSFAAFFDMGLAWLVYRADLVSCQRGSEQERARLRGVSKLPVDVRSISRCPLYDK